MIETILTLVVLVVPLLALVADRVSGPRIAERHHGHHDTYSVSIAFMRALIFAMLFMGGLGLILDWLCRVGVFHARPIIVLGYFAAFLVVCACLWFCMWRYRVVTYDTYMTVTPFIGRRIRVNYGDITGLTWLSNWSGPTARNIRVEVDGAPVATLWGALDTDEILMRIDRYDVLG